MGCAFGQAHLEIALSCLDVSEKIEQSNILPMSQASEIACE